MKRITNSLLLLLCSLVAQAQLTILTGTVTDGKEPLPGVTIRVKETGKGTVTDMDGQYTISLPLHKQTLTLVYSFIGKEAQTVVWKGEKHINIKLKDKTTHIDEVVIVGRPNINEIDVRSRTGTVSEADIRRMKDKPASSIGMALQGNVAGLQIINRGELGTKPQIRVRGTSSFRKGDLPNEPLYVLDGKTITAETFFNLNPEDIKDIKVLKDAVATALYGIKAANGVIEISSTRGFNGKRIISYSMKTGITFRGEQSARMMKSKEKLELERLLENPGTPGFMYSEKYIRKTNPNHPDIDRLIAKGGAVIDSLSHVNTDWYKTLLHTNTYQTHTVSMRGGNEATSYYTSVGFRYQGGQLKGNDSRTVSGSMLLDQQLSPTAILGFSINGAYTKNNTPNGSKFSLPELVYKLNPYETPRSKKLYSFPDKGYADLFNQFQRTSTRKTIGASIYLNWNITKEIELAAVGGLDYLLQEDLSVTPPTAFDEIRPGGPPVSERGKLLQSKDTETNTSCNLRITYRKELGKHNIVLGGNTDFYSTLYDNLGVSGRGLYGPTKSAAAIDNSIDGKNRAFVGGKRELRREIGFGLLAGYMYANTYDLFATYKLDASSILPPDKRNNSAWALGVGVDVKQYAWLRDIKWLRSFKLRGSYGYTASLQGVTAQNTIATFEYTPSGYDHVRGLRLMSLPNTDLQAEQNHIIDYGIRAVIGETSLDLTFYKRTTENALLDVPIASSNGFLTQLRNIGVMENKGIEINISQRLFSINDWISRIRLIGAFNRNKVVRLYDEKRLYTSPDAVIPDYEEGKAIDMIYGLRSQGINPLTGSPTFLRHDGKEADVYTTFRREDFISLGHSSPPLTGSILFSLEYRNFELDLDFYYTLGGKRKYEFTYVRNFSKANYNAVEGQVKDMWFSPGDENKRYPSPFMLSAGFQNLTFPTTRTIGSTDMIRLNGLSVRYRLPQTVLKRFGGFIQTATCAIQGSNLFMLKRFEESDPESGNIVAPLQPVLTFSLNISL